MNKIAFTLLFLYFTAYSYGGVIVVKPGEPHFYSGVSPLKENRKPTFYFGFKDTHILAGRDCKCVLRYDNLVVSLKPSGDGTYSIIGDLETLRKIRLEVRAVIGVDRYTINIADFLSEK